MHVSTGVSMNFCKFLQNIENIVKPILSVTFLVTLGRPPVSKMKLLEKCHQRYSVIFIVSLVFIAALYVSVMGEISLQ